MEPEELARVVDRVRRAGTDLTRVEVKAGGGGVGKALWPTLSAFSNTARGGVVIIGLDEKEGFVPARNFDAQACVDQLVEMARPRHPDEKPGPLTPRPTMLIEQMEVDGAPVVVAEVIELPAAEKPCFVTSQGKERGTYVRIGEGDHRLDTYAVFQLSTLTTPSTADREPVTGSTPHDLDPALIERTIVRLRRSRPRALAGTTSDLEVLARIGVVDRDSGLPTLGGLLALGRYPQQFFPQLMISFAVYPGEDKSAVVGDERMADRAVLDGAIPDMIDDAVAAVLRNLRVRRVVVGTGARDIPEIPVGAIREAMTNAVTHRDYSALARGEQVRVELFPDRLEVHSPGVLWGGRGIDQIFDGGSRSRNESLARLLTEVPFADRDETVGENAGSGIPRMLGEMTGNGLPAPRFASRPSSFVTVLDRFGLMNPETRDWLEGLGGSPRSDTEDMALALLHHLDSLTVDELRRHLAVDTTIAQRALDNLVASGFIESVGGVYRLADIESTPALSPAQASIVEALDSGDVLTVRELSERLGATVNALRPLLRALVASGTIQATAPPSSRNRAYRIPRT